MKSKKPNPASQVTWPLILIAAIALSACSHQAEEKRRQDVKDFEAYVDARRDSVENYLDRTWDDIEREYNEKRADLSKDSAEWAEDVKANYYEAERDWETFKANYRVKSEERNNVAKMDALRNTLVIGGVRSDYTDLTKDNIVRQYEHFVNTVRTNKDVYTKEEWTAININWKALNGRKREIDKDISGADNSRIMKLQVEYTGIKAVNRPFADSENM